MALNNLINNLYSAARPTVMAGLVLLSSLNLGNALPTYSTLPASAPSKNTCAPFPNPYDGSGNLTVSTNLSGSYTATVVVNQMTFSGDQDGVTVDRNTSQSGSVTITDGQKREKCSFSVSGTPMIETVYFQSQ